MIPLLLGCNPSLPPPPDLAVTATPSDITPSGGTLTVTTVYADANGDVALPDEPSVQGLTFAMRDTPRQERIGDRTVVTQVWRFSGKKGSYEIGSLTVTAGELQASSNPVWVDLGVEAPNAGQLADIEDPTALWSVPLQPILCVGLGALGLVGMVGLAFRFALKPKRVEVVVVPADVRCLRAWELIREDPTLTNEDRARELSRIFREYTEEVLGFPAVSWTTTEILERLIGMVHLAEGNVPRAKRLLRATDLVKYAEVSPGSDFFEEMDGDLRAFVASTRPRPVLPGTEEVG